MGKKGGEVGGRRRNGYEDISFVVRSSKRRDLLLAMDGPKTPTTLSKTVNVSVQNMWAKLDALSRQGLVECLTPEARKGRIYRRTKKGDQTAKEIQAMG